MSTGKHDNHETSRRAREHRKKLIATWVAATGTLAAIVALWAMLLPTQLGGIDSFGMKNTPSWMTIPDAESGEEELGFQEVLDRMRSSLDRVETQQQAGIERERAAREGADRLRDRIESANAGPAVNSAEPTTP